MDHEAVIAPVSSGSSGAAVHGQASRSFSFARRRGVRTGGDGRRTTTSLQLVDLTGTGLRRVGLIRPQVVDTDATAYPTTQALARHLYSACPTACGIQWMSRQLDRSRAIMLFADRVLPGSITLAAPSRSVLDSDVEERILDLVEALGMRFLG